jgi:hypothetical protein
MHTMKPLSNITRIATILSLLLPCAKPARANALGIHTMVQDNGETISQLDLAAELCGRGGWVKQLMYVQDGTEWSFDGKWTTFVDGARLRSLNVVARLHYLPPSYRANPSNFAGKPKPGADGHYTAYKDLIRGFVSRFRGTLHYIELWNEPNLAGEWDDQPNAEEFVRALCAGYDGVKEADPTCLVAFPGLAPTNGTPDGKNIDNLVFLRSCYQSNYVCPRDGRKFKDHFDLLASHPYGMNHPPQYNSDKYGTRGYQYELNVMKEFGDDAKKVLITECGYALGNHDDTRYPAITEELRADYMLIAFRDVWARDIRVLGAMPYFLRAQERQPWDTPFFWVYDGGIRTAQFLAVKALRGVLEDLPGNVIMRYGNYPRYPYFQDIVDARDSARAMLVANGLTPVPGPLVQHYHVTAGDVFPAGNPDDRLTPGDADAILSLAVGLNPNNQP